MTLESIQLRPGGCWILPPDDPRGEEEPPVAPVEAPPGHRIEPNDAVTGTLTLFDSWEWSLWHAGTLLVGDGGCLRVIDVRDPATTLASLSMAAPPEVGHAWPDGPLGALVGPVLGVRAARPVAKIDVVQRRWDVRNEDDKVVVRLLEQAWGGDLRTMAKIPLRGYDDEARAVEKRLPAAAHSDRPPFAHALEAASLEPRTWTNKPSFTFVDDTPARDAVVEMLLAMVRLARQTEPGIVEDIDTEFLHDYRVLIRKARSILSLTNGVLDPASTKKLKEAFRSHGRRTNALRDLDVHLLEHDEQVTKAPVRFRPGLAPMYAELVARRAVVHGKVASVLTGATYGRSMRALERWIEQASAGPQGQRPIRKEADRKLARQLTKVLDAGRKISPETPDEAVHALRIDCKKLRYLLEFFRALYPDERLSPVVKALKRLQDLLGTFNDRSVQQDALVAWATHTGGVSVSTVLSVGALVGALAREQAALRAKVESTFVAFDRPAVYGALLGAKASRRRKGAA